MKIYLIRHGKTAGNLLKRYIGRTDEPLCSQGIDEIKGRKYPDAEIVISSGMKRCNETAGIIYPHKKIIICDKLCECDFGLFEGKNYKELSDCKEYSDWIESGGTMDFPRGEAVGSFKKRCVEGFLECVERFGEYNSIAFVIHGGTIMSVMEALCTEGKGYYDYRIENGGYYITEYNRNGLELVEK